MGEIVVNGAIQGTLLALLALGLSLVFSVVKFANVTQVEFATIGAYGTLLTSSVIGAGFLIDAVVSILLTGVVSIVLYYLIFVRLLKRDTTIAMIGSLALSIAIRALIQTLTGPTPRSLGLPLERGTNVLGTLVTPAQIRIVLVSMAVLVLVLAVIKLTPLGRATRAISANPDLARASGIDTRMVITVVWFVAGGLGALAGLVLAIQSQVTINMGFGLLIPVFAAAILGGYGSAPGAVVGAYVLALIESIALQVDFGPLLGAGTIQLPTVWEPAVGFVLLVAVLLVRPQGILGRRVRRA